MALSDFFKHQVLRRARRLSAPRAWAWLAEAAVGTLGLIALNIFFWRDDPGFRHSPFNPFLALVILIGLRYGGSAGLGAGLLGAGAWLSMVASLGSVAIGPEILETNDVWMPALLVLTGLLIGAFVQPLHGRAAFFRKLAEERGREVDLARDTLSRLQQRVEERDALPAAGSTGLLDRVKAMRSAGEEQIWRMLSDLLGEDFGIEAAVYRLRDRRLELAAFQGNAWARRPADRLEADQGLFGVALERGRLVTALELKDPRSEPFLLCGPLNGPRGEKLGAVGIPRIAFRQMNAALLQRLSALLEWTGSCLVHARRQAGGPEGGDADGRFAFDRSFLNLYLDSTVERGKEGCELLLVCIGDYESMPAARKDLVRQGAARILLRAIRSNDFVCETGQPDTFAVVTAGAGGTREAVLRRVRQARVEAGAAKEEIPEHLLVSTVVVRPGAASLDELMAEAEWQLLLPNKP